jgi:hypothetical protein
MYLCFDMLKIGVGLQVLIILGPLRALNAFRRIKNWNLLSAVTRANRFIRFIQQEEDMPQI